MTNLIKYKWEDEKYHYTTDKADKLLSECLKTKKISALSIAVLGLIKCNMLMNANICTLSAKEIADSLGIHAKTIYKYLNELIDLDIIKKANYKDKYAYYVNPHYIKHSRYIEASTLDLFSLSYRITNDGEISEQEVSRSKCDATLSDTSF